MAKKLLIYKFVRIGYGKRFQVNRYKIYRKNSYHCISEAQMTTNKPYVCIFIFESDERMEKVTIRSSTNQSDI